MAGLRFGLIGTGYIGRAHAIALRSVGTVFEDIEAPRCTLLADTTIERARGAAASLGFERATGDWRALVADPDIDVVDICTPNHLHREMALAAIAAGKHVYCEKPLANTADEARQIAAAADVAGVHHIMGFNYICNPLLRRAREIVHAGELGEITSFRGRYFEDYMSDPATPHSWRCERRLAGAGALADLGSHLINLAHFIVGDLARVNASLRTVHATRRDAASGQHKPVENEDVAQVLIEFANGLTGSFDISRIATGYKCGLAFSICGTRGSLSFDQERMNELRLYAGGDPAGLRGFRTILAAPDHPDYGAFCPAPGHGLGINDLKVIEAHNVIRAITDDEPCWPDFREGYRVQRVMEAIEASHRERAWVDIDA